MASITKVVLYFSKENQFIAPHLDSNLDFDWIIIKKVQLFQRILPNVLRIRIFSKYQFVSLVKYFESN